MCEWWEHILNMFLANDSMNGSYCWFTKTDRSVGISVVMGQIKIPGKGVGLETPRWMTEAWSCVITAQK